MYHSAEFSPKTPDNGLESFFQSLTVQPDSYLAEELAEEKITNLDESKLRTLVCRVLDVDPETFIISPESLQGACNFLNNVFGFRNNTNKDNSENIPYLSVMSKYTSKDFVQIILSEHGVLESMALLKDDEESLRTLVFSYMHGNYLGEVIDKPLGTVLLQKIGELAHQEHIISAVLAQFPTITQEDGDSVSKAIRKELAKQLAKLYKEINRVIEYDPDNHAGEVWYLERLVNETNFPGLYFSKFIQMFGAEKFLVSPLSEVPAGSLSLADREAMLEVLDENYSQEYPGIENKDFREVVHNSLLNSFTRENTRFFVLRDESNIAAFNRFDEKINLETRKKVLYFGSFNADKLYRGVGSFMLERTIQQKLHECDAIQAHCDPESDISKRYIEDGFIATNIESVAGKFSFEIWRSKDSSVQLVTKNMSIEELVAIAPHVMTPEDDYFVREVEPNDQFLELDSGLAYLLTRYFTVGGKTYAAFEINPALSAAFVAPKS